MVILVTIAAPLARADDERDGIAAHERARDLVRQNKIIPLETLSRQVLRRFPGRMIGVELDDDDGRLVYEIKILTRQGRVLEVEVDPATGAIGDVEEDD